MAVDLLDSPVVGELESCVYSSPIGRLRLLADREALIGLSFEMGNSWDDPLLETLDSSRFSSVGEQLDQYFLGNRQDFQLPLKLVGTEFQISVWKSLLEIPFGQSWSYSNLALRIGNPKAVRAVGLSNGRNPIPVIVPCHRVIGKDGSLTGFGGGLERKRFLLELEQGSKQEQLF